MSEFTNYGGQQVPALQITTGLYPSTATPLDIRTYVKTKSILESSEPVGCHLHIGMQIYVEDTNEYVTIVGQRPNTSGAQWNHWIFDIIIPQLIASLEADKQNDPSTYAQIKSGVYTTENLINYLFIKCGGPITPVHTVTINFLYSDETVARDPVYLTVLEGSSYSFNVYEITGYAPDRQVVSGTMGNSDIVEDVIYSAIPYTLTYMVEHGGETYQIYNNVLYNTAVEVPSTPPEKSGYNFNGWEYVPELIDNQYMPASNVTAYGIWTEIIPDCTVSITVVPTGSGETTGQGQYTNGENVVLTATPTTGYEFVNWVDGDSSQVLGTDTTYAIESIGRNWNINANFSRIQFTVTANVDPENSGTVSGTGEHGYGDDVTVTATANTGYTFSNWLEDGSFLSDQASYTIESIDADHELTAKFDINTYNVTLSVDPMGGGSVEGNGTYDYGTDVSLTAQPNSGYNFLGWYENGELVSSNANYTIESIDDNHEFIAKFGVNQYTISASANPRDGGSVSGGGSYDNGESCTVTATAHEGYTFKNWTENNVEVSTSASYTFTVTGNRTLLANFTINQYTVNLSANPNEGGSVSGDGQYNHGRSVNITATPANGYKFDNWTENGTEVSTSSSYTFTITGDRTFVANFSKRSYTVDATVNPDGSGTISGTGTFQYGDTATLTATPEDGYRFVNWTENDVEVGTRVTINLANISEDHRLVANFEVIKYTVSVTVTPSGYGDVTGVGQYPAGSRVELLAVPKPGYIFDHWHNSDADTVIGSTNPLVIDNLSGNMNIIAYFTEADKIGVYAFTTPRLTDLSTVDLNGKPCYLANPTEISNVYAVNYPSATTRRNIIAAIPTNFNRSSSPDTFFRAHGTGDTISYYAPQDSVSPATITYNGTQYYVIETTGLDNGSGTLLFGDTDRLSSWSDATAIAKTIGE